MSSAAKMLARIETRAAELGLSDNRVHALAGRRDVIKNIRTNAKSGKPYSPTWDVLFVLARALQTTPRWIATGEGQHSLGF
jgi:hypothetical protein